MNNETINFLKNLQNIMKTQDTDIQAKPRFWVVRDYKFVASYEGCGERVSIILPSDNHAVPIEEYYDYIIENSSEEDYSLNLLEELKLEVNMGDYEGILEWCKRNDRDDAFLFEEIEEAFIAPNTFFITKEEAQNHIKANKHHYTNRAHTYAMTAWRSPVVEKLWDILENTNWDKIKK